MKNCILLFLIFVSSQVFGQNNSNDTKILTKKEISEIFVESVKEKFKISYAIFRACKFTDKSGQFFVLFTESNDSISVKKDTFNRKIKALKLAYTNKELVKEWEINDFTIKQVNAAEFENSIWFWTKYCAFKDLDKDGFIDPIIVYGTSGINQFGDGRIKILVYYKGQKTAIRHQNGVLDFERNTQIDKSFYALPLQIQEEIKQIMTQISNDNKAIFPAGWQEGMKKKKEKLSEN